MRSVIVFAVCWWFDYNSLIEHDQWGGFVVCQLKSESLSVLLKPVEQGLLNILFACSPIIDGSLLLKMCGRCGLEADRSFLFVLELKKNIPMIRYIEMTIIWSPYAFR